MSQLTRLDSPLARIHSTRRVDQASGASPAPPAPPAPPVPPVRLMLSPADQATVRGVLDGKYEYMPSVVFELPADEAWREIFDNAEPVPKPDTSWYHPVMDLAGAARPARLAKGIVLTAAQERVIFRQYNYCRFRVCELRAELKTQPQTDPDQARELLTWHARAKALRHQIADTNLALVLAMAKRTRMSEVDFADLVSEGNMALLRAVDKFDAERGFKFSTYACRAILKAFSRAGVKLSKYRAMFPVVFDPAMERSDYAETKRIEHESDCVLELKEIIRDNRAELSGIEQEVITHRFALSPDAAVAVDPKALTLEQVGRIIGVTKERVRQIQNKALKKIRQTIEKDFLI